MSYLEFLARPYNLAFLALGIASLAVRVIHGRGDRDLFAWFAGLLAACVLGLTINGAIHDLSLGDPAGRFPFVLAISLVAAAPVGWGIARIRQRLFPPVESIQFNDPGQSGMEARIVSREVGEEPGSGRAQWHDGEGGLHIVRCHTEGPTVKFGRQVRLEAFDEEEGSYLVSVD